MIDSNVLDILACPRCDVALARQSDVLHCKGCSTDYPLFDGLPFLFADPGVALDEWRQRYHSRLKEIAESMALIEGQLAGNTLLATTRLRLTHEHDALAKHQEELGTLLSSLDMHKLEADHSTYLAMRTRLPSDQGLVTYYANLHRDWCWGGDENEQSCQLVADAIGKDSPGDLLVLGAGGGRLAYDLHQKYDHKTTVALDFNPLLMVSAARLAAGSTLSLHEFPIAPRQSKDVAVARELRAPGVARDGLSWVLANALRAPFKPASFDTLVTPWLCDVLDEPLKRQVQRWNRLLELGGRWIWFGSHVFRSGDVSLRHGIDESIEIIMQQGFGEPTLVEADIPYMVSPANRHARHEKVIVLSMTKTAEVAAPSRHVALPEWLVRGDLPVPTSQSFQSQGMASRIHAFFFSMIDGQRTLADMATLMEEEKLMPKEEGMATLRNFLIRALEESEGYSTF